MKARIPPDALVLRQLGTGSAQQMAFEGVCPFSICWVITDGKRRWQYHLHINRRKSGIYVAIGLKGGFHSSYHADGTRHWKMGRKPLAQFDKGLPLEKVKGVFRLRLADRQSILAVLGIVDQPQPRHFFVIKLVHGLF